MGYYKCPDCARFLANVRGTISEDWVGQHVSTVHGDCQRHGRVEAQGEWCWEDFDDEQAS